MAKTLADLSIKDKVEVDVLPAWQSRFGTKLIFQVAAKDHTGYPENSVTLITEKIIQIMAFDAKEPTNPNTDRKNYGNNRYKHSNLLQWLNSAADDGEWYTDQHDYDKDPAVKTTDVSYNAYAGWAGFLGMLTPGFQNVLLNTPQTTALETVVESGGSEVVTSKMFLASTTEVGLANENSIVEGALLAYFTTSDSSRTTMPTAECYANRDGYSNTNFATTKNWYWWLRTPNSSNAYYVRRVSSAGALGRGLASYGDIGVRPLCNLKSTTTVSDTPNAAGNYELTYNQPPAISGTDDDLGTKTDAFTHIFQVSDPEGDQVDVEVEIDGRHVQTMANVTLGTNLTANVSGVAWLRLLNGSHTMTITATDEGGNVDVRTLTFTKSVNFIEFTITPLPSDEQPTIAKILATYNIPVLATMQVWVTNNPYDSSPVWEDATPSLLAGLNHVFTNTINASGQKGFGLKVRIDRGTAGAEEEVWIAEIGGAFDVN